MAQLYVVGALLVAAPPLWSQVPRLEPAETCPFEVDARLRSEVECGWLIVPEKRDGRSGRTLRLAYAVARATASEAAPDPIVFLEGGPGVGVLDGINRTLGAPPWSHLRERRDLLFLDSRGTGYSEPSLCTSIDEVWETHDYLLVPEAAFDELLGRAAERCADSAAHGHYAPDAYHSPAVARDLDDLRSLLGYERWNVYGLSYGARYAQTLMRESPETIRGAILDSPTSLGLPWSRTLALKEALDTLFAQCRADSACNRAYPNLEEQFERLLTRLEASPVTLDIPGSVPLSSSRFVVNRHVLLWHVQDGLYGERLAPVLPLLISEAAAGRDEALLAFLSEEIDRQRPGTFAEGLALATLCYDESATSPEFLASVKARHPLVSRTGWYDARIHPVCARFHQARASDRERTPPNTGIPTLVLGGGHDPTSATSTIRYAADTERGATLAFAPALGHVLASDNACVSGLVAAFFEDPTATPDTTCLAAYASIPFITDVRLVKGIGRFSTAMFIVYPGAQTTGSKIALTAWYAGSALILFTALIVWAAMWLWRRVRGSQADRSRAETRALWLAAGTCLVGTLFVVLFQVALAQTFGINDRILAVGVLGEFGWVFLLPWLMAVLALALAVAAVLAWRRGYWSRGVRIHYSLVALASVALVGFIVYWPLL